jgi:hypothetical protein
MHKGSIFDVKLLNIETGEKSDFEEIQDAKGETLVFENTEFPLMYETSVANFFILENCENES